MKERYREIISAAGPDTLLDALHAVQEAEGYVSAAALEVLAEEFAATPGRIYDSASFYSMIRLSPPHEVTVQICRSAPCHVAGTLEVIQVLEEALGIRMGEATADGRYKLEYTECFGQCQASPCLLINGSLHREVNAAKALELLGKGGLGR